MGSAVVGHRPDQRVVADRGELVVQPFGPLVERANEPLAQSPGTGGHARRPHAVSESEKHIQIARVAPRHLGPSLAEQAGELRPAGTGDAGTPSGRDPPDARRRPPRPARRRSNFFSAWYSEPGLTSAHRTCGSAELTDIARAIRARPPGRPRRPGRRSPRALLVRPGRLQAPPEPDGAGGGRLDPHPGGHRVRAGGAGWAGGDDCTRLTG